MPGLYSIRKHTNGVFSLEKRILFLRIRFIIMQKLVTDASA
ncbi:YSIRK-type signal peptide-containing protein [Domibacillus indicus]